MEVVDGLITPPSEEVAVLVEQAALVVEAVSDLVADDHANAAIVEGAGQVAMVEGRLQDARREHCAESRSNLQDHVKAVKTLV